MVPPMFGIQENGAHLAVVGPGREAASAKHSNWVRLVHYVSEFSSSIAELFFFGKSDMFYVEWCLMVHAILFSEVLVICFYVFCFCSSN